MPSRENEAEFIYWAVKGNDAAFDLVNTLFQVSQTLDDLMDKDKPVSDKELFSAFHSCLVEIPRNPFYLKHLNYLVPLFSQYLMDWYDATMIERADDDHLKNVAFGLRSNIGALISQCAYLIGGIDWQCEVSVKVREHIWMETLQDYKRELNYVRQRKAEEAR